MKSNVCVYIIWVLHSTTVNMAEPLCWIFVTT